jgi:DNA damage-inducible protein 1
VDTRARITISINAEGGPDDQDLVTLDLDLSLTLADLKSLVEIETKFPAASQEYFLYGQPLRDNTKTLEQLNIKDGEMLAMMVSRGPQQRQRQGGRRSAQQQSQQDDAAHIEDTRQRILTSPEHMSSLIQQAPDLAEAINDETRFREKWMERMSNEQRLRREHDNEIRLLNEDPFNADAQRRIADIIRRENIEKNLQYAYENNPAGTARTATVFVNSSNFQ